MGLTDTGIKNAKSKDKPYKLSDSEGLCLLVTPTGGKLWRFDYRFMGKRNTISMGIYPEVSLAKARDKRNDARRLLAEGIDPSENRKIQKDAKLERSANSFEKVAREWFAKFKPGWAATHSDKIIKRLEKDVFPWLGGRPIAEITPPEILRCLNRIHDRGALDTAHRAQQNCGQVFRYAVQTGRALSDPSRDLKGALPAASHVNYASITEPKAVAELLRAIEGFRGTFVVQCALKLAPMFFVRPGELRKAKWEDFDLANAEWKFLVSKTRKGEPPKILVVSLATQAVETLRELQALTGHGDYVFPGRDPKKPMSEAAVNAALRRMGYDTKTEFTGHGVRAMARTLLHEELGFAPEIIEHQLSHAVPDSLGTSYNRTKFIEQRRKMMQAWADYLDKLKAGADVIPIGKVA